MIGIGNTPQDRELLASLTTLGAVAPNLIHAAESRLIRAAVAVTGPLWIAAIGVASITRLVRGRLPLVVLHERVGYGRHYLWVPKIGTASVSANKRCAGGLVEIATGSPIELAVDGRFERWLRRTGMDELPQLALVVAGTMRLVGPRPVTPSELDEMAQEGQVGVDRLHPGVVGLWQVLDRHAYELVERRHLDQIMLDNWSRRLQLRLILVSLRQAAHRLTDR